MSRDRSVVLDDLKAARDELHMAQSTLALLLAGEESDVVALALGHPRTGIQIARGIIERDLALRRVEAWSALIDRLRTEARLLGLFDL